MKKTIIILSIIALVSSCSMADVSRDLEDVDVVEQVDTTGTPKHKPIKGIVIHIPISEPKV